MMNTIPKRWKSVFVLVGIMTSCFAIMALSSGISATSILLSVFALLLLALPSVNVRSFTKLRFARDTNAIEKAPFPETDSYSRLLAYNAAHPELPSTTPTSEVSFAPPADHRVPVLSQTNPANRALMIAAYNEACHLK